MDVGKLHLCPSSRAVGFSNVGNSIKRDYAKVSDIATVEAQRRCTAVCCELKLTTNFARSRRYRPVVATQHDQRVQLRVAQEVAVARGERVGRVWRWRSNLEHSRL